MVLFLRLSIRTCLSSNKFIFLFITFFAHGLVIFVAFSIIVDGYRPSWKDYFEIIQWTSGLVVFILTINIILGSNYMFTFDKPNGVNFTLLMPEWHTIFLIMLLIGLISYTVMMGLNLFRIKKTLITLIIHCIIFSFLIN